MRTRRICGLLFVSLAFLPPAAWPQGNPVGPEFRVNTYISNQADARVTRDPVGKFVVVWHSHTQDGSLFGVFGQRYDDGGAPLGAEFRVNTYTTDNQVRPAVASDALGNFVVVWDSREQDAGTYGIFGQRFAASGAPLGPEFHVNAYTTEGQYGARVAADGAGNFVVVWTSYDQDGSSFGIFGQRYDGSGMPLGPEFRVNTFTTNAQRAPAVASSASGDFVVVWHSAQEGSYDVFGRRFAASGTALGPEFRVNTYTTDNQGGAAVAAEPAGGFVVAWGSLRGDEADVFAQRFAATGAPLGPEFRVNTNTSGYHLAPSAAMDASGNFVIAWNGAEAGYDVFGQRYTSSGVPDGPQFRINTYTSNAQFDPEVSSDPAGNFVVVWWTLSAGGIFGQRFAGIFPVELIDIKVE